MINVLFPSGKVKAYHVRNVAEMYCKIYNGVLLANLPQEPLDKGPAPRYNGCVMNKKEFI